MNLTLRAGIPLVSLGRMSLDRNAIAEGIAIASKVRETSKGWNSTEEIRKWRDQRALYLMQIRYTGAVFDYCFNGIIH